MSKRINVHQNTSLSQLDWKSGEVIAFDNDDPEWSSPILLAIPKEIVKGFEDSLKGVKLIYTPNCNWKREEWTLYFEGNILELGPISNRKSNSLNFNMRPRGYAYGNAYVIETALSGKEAIQEYLGENKSFKLYAECIKSGKLIVERSRLEKHIEELGFKFLLPNQLRFR
jgi:hypothetical protein